MDTPVFMQSEPMSLYEETIRDYLDRRTLVINQEIDDDIIENCVLFILRWNKEDKHKPTMEREPIRLLINSPGGDLVVAMHLCDVIKMSKTPIIAIGLGLVASAALHIYIACHERVAFDDTVLLMHDGQLYVQNSTSKAKDAMKFYDNMDKRVKGHVLSRTKMTEEYYDTHYDQELYLYACDAKELGVVDKIIGADADIDCLY